MLYADLVLLTPLAAFFAFAVIAPLVAFAELLRRDGRVRDALRMPTTPRRARAPMAFSLAAVPLLLTVAAMQPVLELGRKHAEREDAELYVVFDTSRSMLAAQSVDDPNRLDRAEELGLRLRRSLPLVRVGVASFTDRVLPHLMPTVDEAAFGATVQRSIGIESPPPSTFYAIRATRIGVLAALGTRNFFAPDTEHRVAVVFSDGESRAVGDRFAQSLGRHRVRLIFVHVWDESERIYTTGNQAEPDYEPEPQSREILRDAAIAVRGRTFTETQFDELLRTTDTLLGKEGKTRTQARDQVPLAPWVTLSAFVPLGLILRRRNL
jgi:hypothetical protein